MCGGIEESTADGQDSNALTSLFNVHSGGTVYFVGSPCGDSSSGSGCDSDYWSQVQSGNVAAATGAVTAPTAPAPTTTSTTSAVSCGAFSDPSAALGSLQFLAGELL